MLGIAWVDVAAALIVGNLMVDTADHNALGTDVIVIAAVDADKVSLIASVAKEYTATVKAGDIIKHLGQELGGKGGGKPDMAQGGAPYSDKLEAVMTDLVTWLAAK